MLCILAIGVLLVAAAVNQVILALFGRRHAANYCVVNRRDTSVADVVDGDNAHCGVLSGKTSTPVPANSTIDAPATN